MFARNIVGSLLVLFLVTGVFVSCGQSDASVSTPTPAPASLAVAVSNSQNAPTSSNVDMGVDPFELGERIFEEEAGEGVGCSYCHGVDGRGDIGPLIRGKMAGDVRFALDSIDAMSFIHLNQEEVEAVAVYLKWLDSQP